MLKNRDRLFSFKYYFRIYWKKVILLVLISLTSSFLATFPITIYNKLLNEIIKTSYDLTNEPVIKDLISSIITYISLQIALVFVLNIQKFYLGKVHAKISHNTRMDMYQHISKLYQDFFDKNDTSEITGKVIQDTDIFVQGFISPINNFSKAIFGLTFTLYFMCKIDPIITLVLLPFALITGILTKITGGKFKDLAKENRKKNTILWQTTQENLKGMRDIHVFQQEKIRYNKMNDASENVYKNMNNTAKYSSLISFLNNFSFMILTAIILILGSYLILNNKTTVAAVIAIITYNTLLTAPFQNIIASFQDIFKMRISKDRLNSIYKIEADNSYDYDIKKLVLNDLNCISFNNVSFGYNEQKILNNITFNLQMGKKYGFVGATGSGKTSILKLCEGLYSGHQGEIKIFDYELNEKNKLSIRQYISYVFQDPFLFNSTLKENIIFSNSTATDEEIKLAISTACVDEIIEKLKDGLNSYIGENGVKLSGGERQRIGIARSLLNKPKILLLDEATSALDNKTEKQILYNIEKNYNNITFIIVAHRLTTINNADCIFLLDDSKIVESGNHEDLIAMNGIYKELYEINKKQI